MTYLLLGFNVLIIMAVWHFMVKRTLLDHTRDKLFDLRDSLRSDFLKRGWSLDSADYGNLRLMINAYLRYTEVHSIWRVVSVRTELLSNENTELRKYLKDRVDANFVATSDEMRKYIANVRISASNVLINFAICNSGLLLLVALASTPFFLVSTFMDQCHKGVDALSKIVKRDAMHWGRISTFVWSRSTKWVAARLVDQQSIEVTISNESHGFA